MYSTKVNKTNKSIQKKTNKSIQKINKQMTQLLLQVTKMTH